MLRTGGCQCGNVRYQCDDNSHHIYVCHCTICQKQSSSAFGISFVVSAAGFKVTQGTPEFFEWTADSGNRRRGAYCGACGSRLWHQAAADKVERINIKAGTFDEPVDISNATHIWLASKLPGVVIPEGAKQFMKEPT